MIIYGIQRAGLGSVNLFEGMIGKFCQLGNVKITGVVDEFDSYSIAALLGLST